VSQVIGSDEFDPSLFARCHVVRFANRSAYGNGKFHRLARIHGQPFLLDRNIKNPAQHPKLLVYARRLKASARLDAELRIHAAPRTQTLREVVLNGFATDIRQEHLSECRP
jgi:hypothetical protein